MENNNNNILEVKGLKTQFFTEAGVVRAVDGVDIIFHKGALPSVPRSVADPLASHEANATGTLNILIAARDSGVKRVVYASSSSVYGNSPKLPKVETMPTLPRSPYAVAKLTGENYCQVFYQVYGLQTVALRYFNVFGPRQDPTSQYAGVIPKFIDSLNQGQAPTIEGDGLQSRDFTYVSNVVQANLLAAKSEGTPGGVFNVACGQRHTINDLCTHLNHLLETKLEPTHIAPRPGDVKHSQADISAFQQATNFDPVISFEEGLGRTVDWYLTQ